MPSSLGLLCLGPARIYPFLFPATTERCADPAPQGSWQSAPDGGFMEIHRQPGHWPRRKAFSSGKHRLSVRPPAQHFSSPAAPGLAHLRAERCLLMEVAVHELAVFPCGDLAASSKEDKVGSLHAGIPFPSPARSKPRSSFILPSAQGQDGGVYPGSVWPSCLTPHCIYRVWLKILAPSLLMPCGIFCLSQEGLSAHHNRPTGALSQ